MKEAVNRCANDEHNNPDSDWDDEYWAEAAMSGTSGNATKDWSIYGEQYN
jgi:hypothetical protein